MLLSAAAQLLHWPRCLLLSGTDVYAGAQGQASLHPVSARTPAATKALVSCLLSPNLCS